MTTAWCTGVRFVRRPGRRCGAGWPSIFGMGTRISRWRAAPGGAMSARSWRPPDWVCIWGIRPRPRRLRGRKKRAKNDRADARLLRTLHVVEVRTLGRLYCTLMDERWAWQQRIHAQVFHQGCPPIRALLTRAGREALAGAELSAAGRQYVDTALRRIDEL